MMKMMISGGGTGGHIFPALAIADAVRQINPSVEILFVGAKGRMEMDKVPAAGYPIEGLWISGLDRKNIARNIVFPFKLVSSLLKSWLLLKKFKPDVVVGVGGFASGPILKVASLSGVPTLIQEQNSYAGLTNKLLARKADLICVAFEGMERYFPAEKVFLSGNPIRHALLESVWTRASARKELGIAEDKKVVLSLGGSLGARTINQMFIENTEVLASQKDIHFIWQYGALYEEMCSSSETAALDNVSAVRFIDDMTLMYSAADLVMARAGALTLTEIAALGKAALLIPSPNVAEDHQTKNAMKLVNAGAAAMIKDSESIDNGFQRIIDLVRNKEQLRQLEQAVKSFYRPDAALNIARQVMKLAKAS